MDEPTGNTPENTKRIPPGLTPWVPGQSGNLSGRPAGSQGLAAQVRKLTREGRGIAEFYLSVYDGMFPANDALGIPAKRATRDQRLEAAQWLADRGFGKAIQTTDLNLSGFEGIDLVLHRGKDQGDE